MSKKNSEELLALKKFQEEKEKVLKSTQKELTEIHKKIAKKIEKKLKNKKENTFTEKDLKRLQRELNNEFKDATEEIKATIENATVEIINMSMQNNLEYFKEIDKKYNTELEKLFAVKYANVSKIVLDAVISGNMYKDKYGLSDRIWLDYQKNKTSIDAIIKDGIKNSKHPYNVAKELEKYVNPSVKRNFKYTQAKLNIEYNSLRLARTSINHAHHQSIIAMAKTNPLVTHIEWMSSNHARVCPLCSSRDGVRYKKDDVPQDHPNGKCMIAEVQPTEAQWDKLFDDFFSSNYEDFDEFANSINIEDY